MSEPIRGESIRGVLPIANTPFRDDDSIDFESLRRQIDLLAVWR
jgi:dihydrodipicolinate synthase/N-acetylneuraminate lyase